MCVGIEEEPTKCFIFIKDGDELPNLSLVFFSSIVKDNDKLKSNYVYKVM